MTIAKTVPIAVGYYHRVHRSVKNRKPRNFAEMKRADSFVKEKKVRNFLETDKVRKADKKLNDSVDAEINAKLPRKKREKFPWLVCENCGYWNKLSFDPRRENLLGTVVCVSCSEGAYWMHYYTLRDLLSNFGKGSAGVTLREMIRGGDVRLIQTLM